MENTEISLFVTLQEITKIYFFNEWVECEVQVPEAVCKRELFGQLEFLQLE